MPKPPERWTEARVFDALRHVFPSPAYSRISHVRNGTGYSQRAKVRTADGLIFSTYPSRGLWMAGVEIKVSRSDWKKELADPSKADEIGKYCSRWFVAAPAGIVPVGELPDAWGLIECKATTASIVKKPLATEPSPPDMLMISAIVRAATEKSVPLIEVDNIVQQRVDKGIADRTGFMASELKEIKEVLAEFEKASGVQLNRFVWSAGRIGAAVRMVLDKGPDKIKAGLIREAEEMIKRARSVLKDLREDEPEADEEVA